jgi:basic membrane protein A
VDNAVHSFVGDFVDGNVKGGADNLYDLESEGVGLATTGGQINDIQTQLDEFRKKIVDGEIKVPTTP